MQPNDPSSETSEHIGGPNPSRREVMRRNGSVDALLRQAAHAFLDGGAFRKNPEGFCREREARTADPCRCAARSCPGAEGVTWARAIN